MPNEQEKSRIEHYQDEDVDVTDMPECDAFHIIDHLHQVGMTLGEGAITHGEISAYMSNLGLELQPWEIKFMKNLSSVYLSSTRQFKDASSKAPFNAEYFEAADRYIQSMKSKRSIRKMLDS